MLTRARKAASATPQYFSLGDEERNSDSDDEPAVARVDTTLRRGHLPIQGNQAEFNSTTDQTSLWPTLPASHASNLSQVTTQSSEASARSSDSIQSAAQSNPTTTRTSNLNRVTTQSSNGGAMQTDLSGYVTRDDFEALQHTLHLLTARLLGSNPTSASPSGRTLSPQRHETLTSETSASRSSSSQDRVPPDCLRGATLSPRGSPSRSPRRDAWTEGGTASVNAVRPVARPQTSLPSISSTTRLVVEKTRTTSPSGSDTATPTVPQRRSSSSSSSSATMPLVSQPREMPSQSSSTATAPGTAPLTRGQEKVAAMRKRTGHLPCHSLLNKGSCVRGKTCGFSHDIEAHVQKASTATEAVPERKGRAPLELLRDMGFHDDSRNQELLDHMDNDPSRVCAFLVEEKANEGWTTINPAKRRPNSPQYKASKTAKTDAEQSAPRGRYHERRLQGTSITAPGPATPLRRYTDTFHSAPGHTAVQQDTEIDVDMQEGIQESPIELFQKSPTEFFDNANHEGEDSRNTIVNREGRNLDELLQSPEFVQRLAAMGFVRATEPSRTHHLQSGTNSHGLLLNDTQSSEADRMRPAAHDVGTLSLAAAIVSQTEAQGKSRMIRKNDLPRPHPNDSLALYLQRVTAIAGTAPNVVLATLTSLSELEPHGEFGAWATAADTLLRAGEAKTCTTLDALNDRLKKLIRGPQKDARRAWHGAEALHERQSAESYKMRLRELAADLQRSTGAEISESEFKEKFINGMPNALRITLKAAGVGKPTEELVALAETLLKEVDGTKASAAPRANAAPEADLSVVMQQGKDCFICGKPGHWKANCPNRRPHCRRCNRSGHTETTCTASQQPPRGSQRATDTSRYPPIHPQRQANHTQPPTGDSGNTYYAPQRQRRDHNHNTGRQQNFGRGGHR